MNVIKVVLKELTNVRINSPPVSWPSSMASPSSWRFALSRTTARKRSLWKWTRWGECPDPPKGVTVDDYYRADLTDETMPETYVDDILTSGLKGVDNMSPKLSMTASSVAGRQS